MIQRGTAHHPLKTCYWSPEQLASFTTIAITTAEVPRSNERLVCKIHSATPVFCFPCEGEVHQSAFEILLKIDRRGKEQFAHLRMVLLSIAVSYRLALGWSVLQGAPTPVLLSGQVLSTRDTWAKTEKIPSPKTLFHLLWWRNRERKSLLSSR